MRRSKKRKASPSPSNASALSPSNASALSPSNASTISLSEAEYSASEESDGGRPKLKRSYAIHAEKDDMEGTAEKGQKNNKPNLNNTFQANFDFHMSQEVKDCVKMNKALSKQCHEHLIRDAHVCVQVACNKINKDGKIKTQDYIDAARIMCDKVPALKNPKPPGWPIKKAFPYWV